ALITDPEHRLVSLGPYADANLPSDRRVLHGVRQQVQDDLMQADPVRAHGDVGGHHGSDHMVRPLRTAEHGERAGHGAGYRDRVPIEVDLSGPYPGGIEQVVDEPPQVRDLTLDDVSGTSEVLQPADMAQHLPRARDGGERIPQLVSEHREKLVLRTV